jgi:PRTRC genetic system protein E
MFMKTLCDLAKVAKGVQFHVLQLEGDNFQVVIQPSLALAEKHPALAQPLMVTETSDKIEAEVIQALTTYTPMLTQASNNLEQIQSELDAAAKAARDKGAKKLPPAAKPTPKEGSNTTNGVKPAAPMQKPAESAPDLFGPTPATVDAQEGAGTPEPAIAEGGGEDDEDDLPSFPGM